MLSPWSLVSFEDDRTNDRSTASTGNDGASRVKLKKCVQIVMIPHNLINMQYYNSNFDDGIKETIYSLVNSIFEPLLEWDHNNYF
eukprot:scaffold29634_cov171-Amphora_coffeaeformis.AAC.4